jgi:hypothetical protein
MLSPIGLVGHRHTFHSACGSDFALQRALEAVVSHVGTRLTWFLRALMESPFLARMRSVNGPPDRLLAGLNRKLQAARFNSAF